MSSAAINVDLDAVISLPGKRAPDRARTSWMKKQAKILTSTLVKDIPIEKENKKPVKGKY